MLRHAPSFLALGNYSGTPLSTLSFFRILFSSLAAVPTSRQLMTFKNYFTAAARRAPARLRGRSDGRLTGTQFNQRVRKSFHERTMLDEVNNGFARHKHNAFDSSRVQNELRAARIGSNYAQLPSQKVLQQIKTDKRDQRRLSSPSRRFLPLG